MPLTSLLPAFLRPRRKQEDLIKHGGYGGGADGTGWRGSGTLLGALPGSDVDWVREVGDPAANSAIFSCLRWIGDNLPEPTFQVLRQQRDGKAVPDELHPLLELLEYPNDSYDGDALLCATAFSYALVGNAYWLIERDRAGRAAEFWWVPYWTLAPRWPQDGSEFIADYLYRPTGRGEGIPYPKEDVIHFQWGLEPTTQGRFGVSRTYPILREICTLNEVPTYLYSILKNMGIAPVLISPKNKDDEANEETVKGLARWWRSLFTRDGRGKPAVPNIPIEVQELSLSPEKLALKDAPTRPELRVCGAMGIHPGVVFLGQSGGPNSFDNGGQMREARRASYQDCLVPMLKRFGKTLTHRFLLPEYEPARLSARRTVRRRVWASWDFSRVEALSEDQDALVKRLVEATGGPVMRLDEARERLKLPVEETDKVYYRPADLTVVKNADEAAPPHEEARENYKDGIMTRNEARRMLDLPPVETAPGGDEEGPEAPPEDASASSPEAEGG